MDFIQLIFYTIFVVLTVNDLTAQFRVKERFYVNQGVKSVLTNTKFDRSVNFFDPSKFV